MRIKDLHILPKFRDGWSYLYVEHCKVEQEARAIAIWDARGKVPVPCASLALLLLGPGTSITHAAVAALADNGCLVYWVGEGGVRFYSHGQGLTRSADNLLHQARLWADSALRLQVVVRLYRMRFPEPLPDNLTLQQIRGNEGVRVREAYARASRETGVPWQGRAYRRDAWDAADPVNRALSAGNSCLYGICQAGIQAVGLSPALGFIHTGKMLSFVYDVADLYKTRVSIPIAFGETARGELKLETRVRQTYQGDQGTWAHRIFRRDLRTSATKNPVDEVMDLLDRRRDRGDLDQGNPRDRLSYLARRGIMAYAERAVLLDRSQTPWRLGHGNPTPYELVTGSGMPELLRAGLDLMKRLVLDQRRFVYVPRTTRARELPTIGNALNPLEYAIIDTNEPMLKRIASGHYRGQEWGPLGTAVNEFIKECGAKVVTGMYRASPMAPAQMFYAHADHAHEAALIALADSVLQEHRGFPMLIDLADSLCSATFGADVFTASTQLAYAAAGEPYRYAGTAKGRS